MTEKNNTNTNNEQKEQKSSKPHHKAKKMMLVSYGKMGLVGWFEHNEAHLPKQHSRVVVKTSRGLELGCIMGSHCYRGGQFRSSQQEVSEYYKDSGDESIVTVEGNFERFAKPEDLIEERHLEASAKEEMATCQNFADEMGLSMKLVDAEHLLGGERIIFYFSADGRVDFRELVKRLAREFQTRIEMRQVGARDEAKLLGDYETCGRECCCRRYLKILKPVSMRMAKLQKATLDPSKISGHCGRLKCCLRYEDKTYRDLTKRLPRRNSKVKTDEGVGRVVDTDVITQIVQVQLDDGQEIAVSVDEIEVLDRQEKGSGGGSSGKSEHNTAGNNASGSDDLQENDNEEQEENN